MGITDSLPTMESVDAIKARRLPFRTPVPGSPGSRQTHTVEENEARGLIRIAALVDFKRAASSRTGPPRSGRHRERFECAG